MEWQKGEEPLFWFLFFVLVMLFCLQSVGGPSYFPFVLNYVRGCNPDNLKRHCMILNLYVRFLSQITEAEAGRFW